jgi:DNA-binding NtrC family response regulator
MTAPSLHILLLEDHRDSAFAFSRVLGMDGHKVTVAATLRQAEDFCSKMQCDLLLCDIELPDGQGFSILKCLQSSRPQTQGIIISAHDDKAHRDTAKAEGFAAYLVKPVTADLLNATILRVMQPAQDLSSANATGSSSPQQI